MARLDLKAWRVTSLRCLLSDAERASAARFAATLHADRYAIARALLRQLLARYTRSAPGALDIGLGPFGKPVLKSPRPGELRFNLSHTADLCIYAVSLDELGVDVERISADFDLGSTARSFLSPEESAWFDRLPLDERAIAFHAIWTRKEACLKAVGAGLAVPPDRLSVLSGDAFVPRCISSDGKEWALREFTPAAGYVGAVASAWRDPTLEYWALTPLADG